MKNLKKSLLVLISVFTWTACTKPTENIKIIVSANIIKYSALIHITDAGNLITPPPNITLTISGTDAGSIYEISGKKVFTVIGGIITLGADPALKPTADRPIKFTVNISAPGYTSVSQSIQFVQGQMQQVVNITIAKPNTEVIVAPPIIPSGTTEKVTLNFSCICANKSDFVIKPSIYIFYREAGTNSGFAYLGYMDNGVITASLVLGKTYDFELTNGGVNYIVTQKIEATNYNEQITMGDICNTF